MMAPLRSPGKGSILLGVVWLTMVPILLRQIRNPDLGYPDADRLLMDGVFVLDFLKELPLTHVYEFTINYYAQYPALSIGYRPPFFPLVEAVFNGIFGVSTCSSRLAVLAFALVGVTAWFKLVARVFDIYTGFWASILLVTTPFVAQWGWYTMTELPVLSMAMLTANVFHRFTETERSSHLYGTAVAFALTVLTKQPAAFLALWFVLYAAGTGGLASYLRRKDAWALLAVTVTLLAPVVAITVWLGKLNIVQSLDPAAGLLKASRLGWENLTLYPRVLTTFHLTGPVLALSVVGLLWALAKRDRRTLYFGLLIVSTYVSFTYLVGKSERYAIFWIPAFCLFAALPCSYMSKTKPLVVGLALVLGGVAVYQIGQTYSRVPNYASGYDEAARYVIEHSESPTVFFDGYNNGYFTYFMRTLDPSRSMYVLRGDKLLSSSAVFPRQWLEVHARSGRDVQAVLDSYGAQYAVVESNDWSGVEIHRTLREFLKNGPFRLAKSIPIATNREPLAGQSLLIYEYLDRKPATADFLELRLPIVGRTIRVPFRGAAPRSSAGSTPTP